MKTYLALKWLVPVIFILALTAALAGLWPGEGTPYPVTNSRGEVVTIIAVSLMGMNMARVGVPVSGVELALFPAITLANLVMVGLLLKNIQD